MLHANSLSFSYDGRHHVLDHWTAVFRPGTTTALVGESGRGKSTLLYLLGLMLTPHRGRISLDGEEISGRSDSERAILRATKFGFVFQDAALDPSRTVMDNVIETHLYNGSPRRSAKMRAYALLERFGVDSRADARPGEVSGGQGQRIALCRALLNSPRVLLADEPTGNLDVGTGELVLAALEEHAASGGITLIVTHDERVANRCSEVVQL